MPSSRFMPFYAFVWQIIQRQYFLANHGDGGGFGVASTAAVMFAVAVPHRASEPGMYRVSSTARLQNVASLTSLDQSSSKA
jgi:hypothetical protein